MLSIFSSMSASFKTNNVLATNFSAPLLFPSGWGLLLLLSIISYWQVITGILRAVISCCEIMWIQQVISLSHSQECEGSVQTTTRSSWAPPVAPWSIWSTGAHAHPDVHLFRHAHTPLHKHTHSTNLFSSMVSVYLVQPYFRRTSLSTHFPWHRNVSCGSSKWRPSVEP